MDESLTQEADHIGNSEGNPCIRSAVIETALYQLQDVTLFSLPARRVMTKEDRTTCPDTELFHAERRL